MLARLMGTFFTVPQDRPDERRLNLRRRLRTLQRTGESVYLSPEGGRIATGEIGPFNKGAFHLADRLRRADRAAVLPDPARIDPGMGFDVRPGVVDVFVKPTIDTTGWHLEDARGNKERVRDLFVEWHRAGRATCDMPNRPRLRRSTPDAAPAERLTWPQSPLSGSDGGSGVPFGRLARGDAATSRRGPAARHGVHVSP